MKFRKLEIMEIDSKNSKIRFKYEMEFCLQTACFHKSFAVISFLKESFDFFSSSNEPPYEIASKPILEFFRKPELLVKKIPQGILRQESILAKGEYLRFDMVSSVLYGNVSRYSIIQSLA